MEPRIIYLDNASTSFPKPAVLWESTREYLDTVGVSPGRGSYRRARHAEDMVDETRAALAGVLGVGDSRHIAFTANATHALNIAIKGVLAPGDHVLTTGLEHNSVLRPLAELSRAGVITYTVVPSTPDGAFDLDAFRAALTPHTRLMVVNHASNVIGVVAPAAELAALAHEYGVLFLLDASQTAGFLDVDADANGIDLLAVTGHKSLHGPSGIGALYVRDPMELRRFYVGGSGVNSLSLRHPATMPEKFEAGTLNYLGIAGLRAVLAELTPQALRDRQTRLLKLTEYCLAELRSLPAVTVYDVRPGIPRTPVISINVDGLYAGELGVVLDREFNVLTRAGLHCAPLIHRTLGTAPHGTVRISLGDATSEADIAVLADALGVISAKHAALTG